MEPDIERYAPDHAPTGDWVVTISSATVSQTMSPCVCGGPDCYWHAATYPRDFVRQ